MKKYIFLLLFIFFLGCKTSDYSKKNTQIIDDEKNISSRLDEFYFNQNQTIDSLILVNHPLLRKNEIGEVIRPDYVNLKNEPLYLDIKHGKSATDITRANELKEGGTLGLDLNGEGITIAVWDKGGVMLDHDEFTENGSIESVIVNPATYETNNITEKHPTAVVSCIISRGTFHDFTWDVTGLAPKLEKLKYFDWDADLLELNTELQNDPDLILSNHSYGTIIFNEDGTLAQSPETLGTYSDISQIIDQILNNYPYYTMIVAAGNDGYESYVSSGQILEGLDLMVDYNSSKNSLSVGSINNSDFPWAETTLSEFSSGGPTNDGRVKPEIMSLGQSYIVAGWDEDNPDDKGVYFSVNGTSFASPSLTGGSALLQQYYKSVQGNYMLSSTLRALLCHSAEDITAWGNSNANYIGPDARTGYGLVNFKKAAEIISHDVTDPLTIIEFELSNNETYEVLFSSNGNEKLTSTICWNDPYAEINQEKDLVNDIDLRIFNNDSTFFPWVLDSTNFINPAIKADNSVDIIEKIEIENPNGDYSIKVSHKGTLESSQKVSLIISGNGNLILSRNNNKLDDRKLLIYPIPATKILNLRSLIEDTDIVSVKLMDLNSRVVYRLSKVDEAFIQIPTHNLEKGVYFISVEFEDYTISKKITLQ